MGFVRAGATYSGNRILDSSCRGAGGVQLGNGLNNKNVPKATIDAIIRIIVLASKPALRPAQAAMLMSSRRTETRISLTAVE